MLLKKLIKNCPYSLKKIKVKGLALNSEAVKRGFIFFAIKGNKFNGESYIHQAIKNGAAIIICSKKCKFQSAKTNIIKIKNVKKLLAEITSKFYKQKPKNIIAVTGTNGKTSVADFFYQILDINNIPVASIGTLGIKTRKKMIKTNLTSPDIITLHKNLEILKKNKIDNVIIEASSHGLSQNRLDNLKIKAGIFTNFSQDHLDYHKTMKNYFKSKLILFKELLPKNSYIIANNHSKQFLILKKIAKRKKLKLIDTNKTIDEIKEKEINLVGSFQIKNLSMAVLAARLCNLNKMKINRTFKKISNVEGRLELVKEYPNNIKVFVDYAHTPDALLEVLKSIRSKNNNNISLVFGCGGERDFKKRPLMAKIAKKFCKKIYVTDDNPRFEKPDKIRRQIIKYLKGSNYKNIGNRSKAIRKAITNAEPNETILVAGKGHENLQDYGDKIIFISDKQILNKINFSKKNINLKKKNYLSNTQILKKLTNNKKIFNFNGLSIDSRKLKKENLFLAIEGKNNDGNNFISKAIKKGAKFAITSKKKKNFKVKKKLIFVDNSLVFLKKFGELKRLCSNAKILAITGSAGKTSLKNLLSNLLEKYGKTFASPKSYNNHFGVPISLSNLNLDHQFGVFEIGMSKAGEINNLSKIIRPDLAIITNIAEAHIENFKNIKGIAEAKSEIINNISKNGTIILNRDDKFFSFLKTKAMSKNIKVISFGRSKVSDIALIKTIRKGKKKIITVNVQGKYLNFEIKEVNIYNVLASLATLQELGLKLKKSLHAFKRSNYSDGRGKLHKIRRYKKNFNLIDESYNANPLSAKYAIERYVKIKKEGFKKYLLLGDMLELGKKSEVYHKKLFELINRSDIDKVFIKGQKTLFTYKKLKNNKRGNIIQCNQDVDMVLKNIIANNDYLMIKGSNATGLNAISNTMIKGN